MKAAATVSDLPTIPKNMTRLECKQAYLVKPPTWPGVAGAETTCSKIPGVKMFYTPMGLELHAKGQVCIVPIGNVINVVLISDN